MDSLSRIENQRWDRKPQNKSCKQLLTLVSPFYVIAHCLPPKGRGALPLHVLTTLSTGAKVHYSKVVSNANSLLLSFVVTSLRFALARELLMYVSRGGSTENYTIPTYRHPRNEFCRHEALSRYRSNKKISRNGFVWPQRRFWLLRG